MRAISLPKLQELAAQVGLSIVAVAQPEDLHEDRSYLERWQRDGYAGEMAYMRRDPALLSSPTTIVPGTRSIVTVAVSYDRRQRTPLRRGFGRVARYAWGRDYHKVMRRLLEALCRLVREHLRQEFHYRVFSDSVPLLERALARRSGIGFIGKNTMLIIPGTGSFLFLGEILWELEVVDEHARPVTSRGSCGTCSRCIASCPTQAFVEPHTLDARRCISYLSIEKRGTLSWQERRWLGEWIFGCDVCQDVCPFNSAVVKRGAAPDVPEYSADAGVGEMLELRAVLGMRTEREFQMRFGGTALTRARREGLVRNAAIVAANTEATDLLPDLENALCEDPSAVVRRHALWSHFCLSRLEGNRALERAHHLVSVALRDSSSEVLDEARQLIRQSQ